MSSRYKGSLAERRGWMTGESPVWRLTCMHVPPTDRGDLLVCDIDGDQSMSVVKGSMTWLIPEHCYWAATVDILPEFEK